MNLPKKQELDQLLSTQGQYCISIFMPTHQKGMEIEQDPIRFKNLIKQAKNDLDEKGYSDKEKENLLKPADEFLNDTYFWRYMSDGLAVFIGPDTFNFYRAPLQFDEQVYISEHFNIKPLIPLLSGDIRFYVLALNLKHVKLYRASRFNMQASETDAIPESIEDFLKYDDPERQLQFHTGTGVGNGRRAAMFHGQGVSTDDVQMKKNILRFFQAVDNGVKTTLKDESAPLVIAGVEYLAGIYREANSYNHLFSEIIDHNPLDLKEDELHKNAWAAVEPHFRQEQEKAIDQYHQLLHNGKASHEIEEIIKAAFQDRIKYLFVNLAHQQWGKYSLESDYVERHDTQEPDDEDLVEAAIKQTLRQNGKVFAMDKENMPAPVMAAVFRF